MTRTHVALGTPERFVSLGDFNVTVKGHEVDVYYNMDFGNNRLSMFDANTGSYKNLEKAHQSFHHSGQVHMKEQEGKDKVFLGHVSNGSVLSSSTGDPLILCLESFFFDKASTSSMQEKDAVFLRPPTEISRYSILWFWVPEDYPYQIHPRLFYMNLWGSQGGYHTFQTAGLGDMAVTREMRTISSENGWEVRGLFLTALLPAMTQGVVLIHPKGVEQPWRSFVSVDAHLPLSQMIKFEAVSKKCILCTEPPQIASVSRTPMGWVKQ